MYFFNSRNGVRAAKKSILVDEAHIRNDREGRYQRSLINLGKTLGCGQPIGYRHFNRVGDYDVCQLVVWFKDEDVVTRSLV